MGTTSALSYAPIRQGFKGFKMYSPEEMCCEICSRLSPDCLHWATPPSGLADSSFSSTGCDLFFNDNRSLWIPESMFVNNSVRHRRLDAHGAPHPDKRPLYFAGCGWSFWMTLDYPCLNGTLDDQIPVVGGNEFTVLIDPHAAPSATLGATIASSNANYNKLPLCTTQSEYPVNHKGRWVRQQWPSETECPIKVNERDPKFSASFFITRYDTDHPLCYLREDISVIGGDCMEMNCRFIDVNRIWKSDVHLEKQWYGFWQNYDCRYVYDYSNEEIQQCITERKIYEISGEGRSIWEFLKMYLDQRLDGMIMHKRTAADPGISIQLTTLAMLHHKFDELREIVSKMPLLDRTKTEHYWINSMFLSSEREHEARGPVQILKSTMVQDILGPKNYTLLNFYDLTAAFTYDTATQMDGMHIIGPPMKTILAKLFHHVCYSTSVSNIRLQIA
jgi:hypothetical protein